MAAQQFEDHAEGVRVIADELADQNSRDMLNKIAADYERFASRAETIGDASVFLIDTASALARCARSAKKRGASHAENDRDQSHEVQWSLRRARRRPGVASLCIAELGRHGRPRLGEPPCREYSRPIGKCYL